MTWVNILSSLKGQNPIIFVNILRANNLWRKFADRLTIFGGDVPRKLVLELQFLRQFFGEQTCRFCSANKIYSYKFDLWKVYFDAFDLLRLPGFDKNHDPLRF